MIKIENLETAGWGNAIYGMRLPMLSMDKSDSYEGYPEGGEDCGNCYIGEFFVGANDLDLMRRLYKAGTEHRKFMRQIFVSFRLTAPVFLWAEIDTYKVGVTRDSGSFMHKGTRKPFTVADFSCDVSDELLDIINDLRDEYLDTKDPNKFEELRCNLPSGYMVESVLTMNYEVVASMIRQRRNHRLSGWREFCDYMLYNLPYLRAIMGED